MKVHLIKSLLARHIEEMPRISYTTIKNPEAREKIIEHLDEIKVFSEYMKEVIIQSITP